MPLVINDMIENADGRKKEILIELKKLNKKAYLHMLAPYSTFKPKYQSLQKTKIWTQAKELLIEYFTMIYIVVKCPICKQNTANDFVLHHEEYHPAELFTPEYVQFIHNKCHSRAHMKWY